MMADTDQGVNPILAARPPATDPITYLTIIEYNLNEDNLPALHEALQDTELTSQIGWDLIHLLLPLLPTSTECLEDIATRGNPREVILKVTEALRLLEFEEPERDSDDDEATPSVQGSSGKAPVETGESSQSPPLQALEGLPVYVLKFEVLLSLLSTLHRRLKTKYPSRFLSTSLQAVLTAYNRASRHHDELTLSAIKFVKTLSGTKRPHLPPRTSSGNILKKAATMSEPDPEAQVEAPTADENTLVNRLLQSFITHVLEDYVLSLSSEEDVPGLAWCSRLMEKFEPERIVRGPGKITYAERFAQDESLKSRSDIVGQVVALTQDLGLSTKELVQAISDPESEKQGVPNIEDEPPESASDIPLSKTGALVLFVARTVKQELYATTSSSSDAVLDIFPDHAVILNNFIGTLGPQTAGLEPEALLDAVLSLGLIAIEKNSIGDPSDDEEFAKYLQTSSLISANTPSPSLRGHAHYLTSTILRSHPSDLVRLTFIRDTLEHCPYENLKATAVGWLKGETLEANFSQQGDNEAEHDSIFSTPVAVSTVSPYLFPDLTSSFHSAVEVSESWIQFRNELGFLLAALNFYWLLLMNKALRDNLDISTLHKTSNIEESYLHPLKEVIARFKEALRDGGELAIAEGEEGIGQANMDLAMLEHVVGKVEKEIQGLGSS